MTKDLHFHVLNKFRLYGDRCNYRGVKDPNFTQTKYKTKQNNTEKSEKINSFQFKKQCRAVICFSKF